MQILSINNNYSSGLRRLAAFLIDRMLLSAIFSLFIFRWFSFGDDWDSSWYWHWHSWTFNFLGYNFLREAAIIAYYSLMESSRFQGTLGKIALGIKVVDQNNQRVEFSKAMLRNISKILSAFIFGIGYIMIIFDERKQGLHDKIADTFVVKV